MTLSDFRHVTDELLSAYIDGEVNEEERALVEAAIAQDEEIAWRLNSLRQTVFLLRDLPELTLPRSFTLNFEQMNLAQPEAQLAGLGVAEGETIAVPAMSRVQPKAAPLPQAQAGFWEQLTGSWRGFWQAGNPILRNAAAVSFALMLMLVGGAPLVNRAMQPVGMLATAPEAAPAAAPAQESAGESVALAQPTTESAATESPASESTTESLQVQEDAANKTPVEETPAEESARAMQAPASPAGEAVSAEAATEAAESESVVQAGEAAVAEAAPTAEGATVEEAPAGEAAAASVMAAPDQPAPEGEMPPLVEQPFPGGGAGGMGGGGDGPPGAGGAGDTGDLVPEAAYNFDVDPLGQPTPVPAEEAVTASVAAASAVEAPAEAAQASAADVAVTPAVEAPAAASGATADEARPTPAADSSEAQSEEAAEETAVETASEPAAEPPVEPTPEEVALVAPEAITSSEVVEVVEADDAVAATSPGANLPVLWIAQGSALLLTVVLASLWWRSRGTPQPTSRRPRR